MKSHTLHYHYPVCVTILMQTTWPEVQRHGRAAEACYINSSRPHPVLPIFSPPILQGGSTLEHLKKHPEKHILLCKEL